LPAGAWRTHFGVRLLYFRLRLTSLFSFSSRFPPSYALGLAPYGFSPHHTSTVQQIAASSNFVARGDHRPAENLRENAWVWKSPGGWLLSTFSPSRESNFPE
jgi:hypothetical protein